MIRTMLDCRRYSGAHGLEHRAQGLEHRAQGIEHRAQGLEHRAQGIEHREDLRVHIATFRDFGFRISDCGFMSSLSPAKDVWDYEIDTVKSYIVNRQSKIRLSLIPYKGWRVLWTTRLIVPRPPTLVPKKGSMEKQQNERMPIQQVFM